MKQLTRRVWYLPHSPASDRPALGYIRGDRRALMVDAGNSPAHVRQFLRSLEAEGLPAPDLAVLTHRHWDHTGAVPALVWAAGAPVGSAGADVPADDPAKTRTGRPPAAGRAGAWT